MKMVPLSDVADLIDYGVTAPASLEPIGPKFLRITDLAYPVNPYTYYM